MLNINSIRKNAVTDKEAINPLEWPIH